MPFLLLFLRFPTVFQKFPSCNFLIFPTISSISLVFPSLPFIFSSSLIVFSQFSSIFLHFPPFSSIFPLFLTISLHFPCFFPTFFGPPVQPPPTPPMLTSFAKTLPSLLAGFHKNIKNAIEMFALLEELKNSISFKAFKTFKILHQNTVEEIECKHVEKSASDACNTLE